MSPATAPGTMNTPATSDSRNACKGIQVKTAGWNTADGAVE